MNGDSFESPFLVTQKKVKKTAQVSICISMS